MFYYLAIGLIAMLSAVNFCARLFVTNTIAFSMGMSFQDMYLKLIRLPHLGTNDTITFRYLETIIAFRYCFLLSDVLESRGRAQRITFTRNFGLI